MCGITLFVHRDRSPVDQQLLTRATAALRHRGPDGYGIDVDGHVGLGHARLAIVDIAGGRQPLWNEDGTVGVVCNGEIYNYRQLRRWLEQRGHVFSTNSDSEVIVHLYEEDPEGHIDRLVGMFAYVVYDKRRDTVQLVRDRIGIKPLFIYVDSGHLLAASEMKSLFHHPAVRPALDGRVISDFLTFGYTMGPRTAFEGIRWLPPGHRLVYDGRDDSVRVSAYWRPSFPRRGEYRTDDVAAESRRFLDLFNEVVLDHTTGDVPTGVFMSGGIDSTALAAILSRGLPERVKTFSLSFEDPRFDETSYYSEVAERWGLDSRVLPVTAPSIAELEAVIYHLEQPQIVTLDVANYRLSSFAHQHGYKVVLAGDGADEQLGGYDHFSAVELLRDKEREGLTGAARDEALAAGLSTIGFPPDFRSAFLSEMSDTSPIRARFGTVPPWYMIWRLNDAIKRPLLRDPWPDTLGPESVLDEFCRPLRGELAEIDDINKCVHLELGTRLPNWILWKSDRDSMAHSVEVRVPYLDARVVDFFAGLHPKVKGTFLREKAVLRQAFAGLLPERIINRRKFAFNTPMGWLFDDPPPRVLDLLGEASLRKSGLFDPVAVSELLGQVRAPHDRGLLTHSLKTQTLIGVLTTQMLHEQFVAGGRPASAS